MVGAEIMIMPPVTFLWLVNIYGDKLSLEGVLENKLKQYSKLNIQKLPNILKT